MTARHLVAVQALDPRPELIRQALGELDAATCAAKDALTREGWAEMHDYLVEAVAAAGEALAIARRSEPPKDTPT